MPSLNVRNLSYGFNDTTVVDDLSFVVSEGSVFGLLGPNGAGKTTTIRLVLDIYSPDGGVVELEGAAKDDRWRSHFGYLPEERGLYPRMSVLDSLLFFGMLGGLSKVDSRQRARIWLDRLGAEGWESKRIDSLSRGMQQKVQLLTTFIHDPPVLILDEPFQGLDPVNAELLRGTINELRDDGKTIILSTHRMDQAERLCDDIYLLNRGTAMLAGNIAEIKSKNTPNVVEAVYHGDRTAVYDPRLVKDAAQDGETWRLALADDADPQRLLQALVRRGSVARFQVIEPSLEDLFIDAVRGP